LIIFSHFIQNFFSFSFSLFNLSLFSISRIILISSSSFYIFSHLIPQTSISILRDWYIPPPLNEFTSPNSTNITRNLCLSPNRLTFNAPQQALQIPQFRRKSVTGTPMNNSPSHKRSGSMEKRPLSRIVTNVISLPNSDDHLPPEPIKEQSTPSIQFIAKFRASIQPFFHRSWAARLIWSRPFEQLHISEYLPRLAANVTIYFSNRFEFLWVRL
jgi:hypothetical protein